MNGTLNKVILIGRLGDNIKLTYFEGGNCIGRFPLATNEEYTNKSTNEKVTETDWHTIVVRNKLAEIIEKYTTKGDIIYIEGRIKTRQWQAEDGTMRYATEIHATDINLLPNRRDSQQPYNQPTTPNNKEDENLPF
ncbi:MAG: single-stranded DNA-binding protein [Capnocytophaga sp.]|nr:single-stranded DNA-binding protein [Capnocytophaga sp.]